jgi:uncharacterized repeat protein (TIGR01451 family)
MLKACLLALLFGFCGALEAAYAQLTITPTTWNVIGIDSNKPSVGPDSFEVGARVCNTSGTAINNVVGNFIWDSTNAYINLNGSSITRVRSLAAGTCVDVYYEVVVTRTTSAYDTARRYHITASGDNAATVSTPTPRELYVEHIISQGRNSVNSITGPTTVYVGQTVQYTVNAATATQGYEQLESFLSLSNIIFQVQSISTTYTAPTGATNNKFYADGCGWDNNPASANYRSCIGPVNYSGGKVGGTVITTYTVKVLSTGTTTATTLILDFSGSSYHYNADFGTGINSITITALPPPLTLGKTASAAKLSAGGTVTYTLRLTNGGTYNMTVNDFVDVLPTGATYTAGSSAFNGAAIADPLASGSTLTWDGSFVVPAGQTRDLTYRVTLPNTQGTYTNQAIAHLGYAQVDTTSDPNDNTPATASTVVQFPPNVELVKSYAADTTYVQPNTEITYTINFSNSGGTGAVNLYIRDIIPANTIFKVNSANYTLGAGITTPVTLRYTNVSLPNPDPTLPPLPPPDNDPSWSYQPTGSYDTNVKFVRWFFSGTIPAQTSGSVTFIVRVN